VGDEGCHPHSRTRAHGAQVQGGIASRNAAGACCGSSSRSGSDQVQANPCGPHLRHGLNKDNESPLPPEDAEAALVGRKLRDPGMKGIKGSKILVKISYRDGTCAIRNGVVRKTQDMVLQWLFYHNCSPSNKFLTPAQRQSSKK